MNMRVFEKRAWTPEDDAALRRLWDEGLPSRAIARVFQVSKNSIIGRAHRLKVTPRPSPLPRAPKPVTVRRPPQGPAPIEAAPLPIELVPLPVATPEDRAPGSGNGYRRPLKVLTPPLPPAPPPAPRIAAPQVRRCLFPIGDPKDRARFHYCDAPVTAHDRVYCAEHHDLCYLGRARTVYADARDRMIR